MIKRLSIFVVFVVLCMALVSPLVAQERGTQLSITGDYWDPDDGDDNVWGPGVGLSFPLGSSEFNLDFKGSWFSDVGSDTVGDLAIVPLDLGLSWHKLCNKWEFSLGGGATWANANLDSDESSPVNIDIDSDWGAYVGAGAAYYFKEKTALLFNLGYRFLEFDAEVANLEGEFEASGLTAGVGVLFVFN